MRFERAWWSERFNPFWREPDMGIPNWFVWLIAPFMVVPWLIARLYARLVRLGGQPTFGEACVRGATPTPEQARILVAPMLPYVGITPPHYPTSDPASEDAYEPVPGQNPWPKEQIERAERLGLPPEWAEDPIVMAERYVDHMAYEHARYCERFPLGSDVPDMLDSIERAIVAFHPGFRLDRLKALERVCYIFSLPRGG